MTNKINLKKQQLFWLDTSSEPFVPQIKNGKVWVTMKGCQKDFIVCAPEYLPLSDQEILIEALSDDVEIDMIQNEF